MRDDKLLTIVLLALCAPLWFWSIDQIEQQTEWLRAGIGVFIIISFVLAYLVMHHISIIINDDHVPF